MSQNSSLNASSKNTITIVSGLPRSGTSMMMKMLAAGGMEILEDNIRIPDQDNPKGYFEFERVKNLPDGDHEWLVDAEGKVVKIIAFFLPHLPDLYTYRIIFMHRPLTEILSSQKAMLSNRGKNPEELDEAAMTIIYEKHLRQVDDWFKTHPKVQRMDVQHHDLIFDPIPQIERINHFFQGGLDTKSMQMAIDPNLYRQRKSQAPDDEFSAKGNG